MRLTKTETEEIICLIEWYLDDEHDKEQRELWRNIVKKLKGKN